MLTTLIEERGSSGDTYGGTLGRVHKDRWESALHAGESLRARGLFDKAIGVYLSGFETDGRDEYPRINAVMLMDLPVHTCPNRHDCSQIAARNRSEQFTERGTRAGERS